jgi:hypothetical protein
MRTKTTTTNWISLPLLERIYGFRDILITGASATAAAVILPYLHGEARKEIFDETKPLSPHEKIYAKAFKEATAVGERSRGAHVLALRAVFDAGLRERARHPIRMNVAALFEWLRQSVSP